MKNEFWDWAMMFGAGALSICIRYLQGKLHSIKLIFLNILIVIGIVFFLVPAIAEHFELTIKTSCFLTWVLSLFNDKIMKLLEQGIDKKGGQILNS